MLAHGPAPHETMNSKQKREHLYAEVENLLHRALNRLHYLVGKVLIAFLAETGFHGEKGNPSACNPIVDL